MLYLAADHQGFEVKEKIQAFLESAGIECEDLGAQDYEQDDDYPDYAFLLGEKVAQDKSALGIILCGSGVGVCAAVNKVAGIRAASAKTVEMARAGRNDDDMNVLVIDKLTFKPEETFPIIEAFLNTPFAAEERYVRRLAKISAYENEN